jgi:hypothetical protein
MGGGVGTAGGERRSIFCVAFANAGAARAGLGATERSNVSVPAGTTFLYRPSGGTGGDVALGSGNMTDGGAALFTPSASASSATFCAWIHSRNPGRQTSTYGGKLPVESAFQSSR